MGLPKIIFDSNDIESHKDYAKSKKVSLEAYKSEFIKKNSWQIKYLEYLIKNIEEIVATDNIDDYKIEFDKIHQFKETFCLCEIGIKKFCSKYCQKKFSHRLQEILGYKHKQLVKYFLYNSNKACYICNAQYTVVAQKDYKNNYKGRFNFKPQYFKSKVTHVEQGDSSAKFQLDHYYPKSLYPALSISLYNLYPICGSCNQTKSDDVLDIKKLHSNFKFEIEEDTILNFYKSGNSKNLILHLDDRGTNDLVTRFDLKGIYDNHIDIVEELFIRKIKYSESYKNALINKHPDITPNFTSIDDRLIVGTYDKSEGIYKRPLSKLLQDLNDQLDDYVK